MVSKTLKVGKNKRIPIPGQVVPKPRKDWLTVQEVAEIDRKSVV